MMLAGWYEVLQSRLPQALALTLSIVAHICITLVWSPRFPAQVAPRAHADAQAISVSLIAAHPAQPSAGMAMQQVANPAIPALAGQRRPHVFSVSSSIELPALAGIEGTVPPTFFDLATHYFKSAELTEKPQVVSDIPPDFSIVLPGISAQRAIAHLFINASGGVDKVDLESMVLSEGAERSIADAFANVRFLPGKLGELPVKSVMRIEILLEPMESYSGTTQILSLTPVR